MIRKGYALLLTLTVLISSALAESFTPPAGIDFDLVINKKGTQQLYFANPDNYAEPYMNARAFPLASGEAQEFQIPLGVVWSLFPELESTHDTVGIDIRLQASSIDEYESGAANRYMMELTSSSGKNVPSGLNYSINVYDLEASGEPSESIDPDASLLIEDSQITSLLLSSERTTSLFRGEIGPEGTSDKKLLVLELIPPKDSTDSGDVYYMEGDYEGYLILHVETY